MKYVLWFFCGLLVLAALFGLAQYVASERVEVVVLETLDEAGEPQITRLWIVDDEGYQYLRVGTGGSGWFSRIQANETIKVTRNEETQTYTTVLRKDKSERIDQLMREKYTWGDEFIYLVAYGDAGSIAIELHPVDD